MLLTTLKVALVVFLIVSVGVIIFVGVRRSRANRGNPDWPHRNTRPSQMDSLHGRMPATPRPDWADDQSNPNT
jgi:hypothetical protein